MTQTGIELIAAERIRQIEAEGWTSEHDDKHTDQSLAMAAALYATPKPLYRIRTEARSMIALDPWPWHRTETGPCGSSVKINNWDKRSQHSRLRKLEIAGALIAAEIDRLLRAKEGAAA